MILRFSFVYLLGCVLSSFSLPIIDIMPLRDLTGGPGSFFHSRVANCTAAIEAAMREYGCFIATGHDLEFGWQDALDAAQSVFELPLPALEEVAMSRTNVFGRGYIERGKEAGVQSTYFEHKEGYSYGHPRPPKVLTNLMEQRNIWPEGLSEKAISAMEILFEESIRVAKLIIAAFSDSASVAQADGGEQISLMRLFHYFSEHSADSVVPPESNKTVIGSSPHTDWGFLTVILQDQTGGLQFFHNGNWMDVPVVEHGLVINGGDYLRMVSRERYQSPIHRVLCPKEPDAERYSFVFFFYPPYTAPVTGFSSMGTKASSIEYNTFSVMVDGEVATVGGDVNIGGDNGKTDTNTGTMTAINNNENENLISAPTDQGSTKELSVPPPPPPPTKTFGDHILEKWRGVYVN